MGAPAPTRASRTLARLATKRWYLVCTVWVFLVLVPPRSQSAARRSQPWKKQREALVGDRLFPPSLRGAIEPTEFFAKTQFGSLPCNEYDSYHVPDIGAHPPVVRFGVVREEYNRKIGTGSAMWFYRACLLWASLHGRTLVSGFCSGPTCPLVAWSACSAARVDELVSASQTNPQLRVDVEECRWTSPDTMLPAASRPHYWGSKHIAAQLAANLRPGLRARLGGRVETLLFWRAVSMCYFLRLNPDYDARFQALRQWKRPAMWPVRKRVATFHVRHDDKDPWEGRQIPLAEFMTALFKYHSDVRHVHVCTDDKHLSEEFRKYPNVTFHMYNSAAAEALDRRRKAPIYRDLYTLAMGDVFFGTYSSNFGMMAMDLHLLRTGFCSDLVMMDDFYHIEGGQYGHLFWNATTDMMDLKVTRQKDNVTFYQDPRLEYDPDYKSHGRLVTRCSRRRGMRWVAGRRLDHHH